MVWCMKGSASLSGLVQLPDNDTWDSSLVIEPSDEEENVDRSEQADMGRSMLSAICRLVGVLGSCPNSEKGWNNLDEARGAVLKGRILAGDSRFDVGSVDRCRNDGLGALFLGPRAVVDGMGDIAVGPWKLMFATCDIGGRARRLIRYGWGECGAGCGGGRSSSGVLGSWPSVKWKVKLRGSVMERLGRCRGILRDGCRCVKNSGGVLGSVTRVF